MAEELPEQMIKKQADSARIEAWAANKRTKADNRAEKELAIAETMQKKKKASLEAMEKQIELEAERLRHVKMEMIRNKEARSKKKVEEKKAVIEAKREHEKHKIDDKAEKFRVTSTLPNKCFGLCSDD